MNAYQHRRAWRIIKADHFRWPLGTPVHGYPCKDGRNCIVDFTALVMDVTFGAPRYGHHVEYRNLRKIKGMQ